MYVGLLPRQSLLRSLLSHMRTMLHMVPRRPKANALRVPIGAPCVPRVCLLPTPGQRHTLRHRRLVRADVLAQLDVIKHRHSMCAMSAGPVCHGTVGVMCQRESHMLTVSRYGFIGKTTACESGVHCGRLMRLTVQAGHSGRA